MKTSNSIPRLLATALAAGSILLATITPSQASLLGAQHNARALFQSLSHLGLNIRPSYSHGLLRKGQSTVVQTHLLAGNTYYLAAGGCEDAFDVDIAVFDENHNLIARDHDVDKVAVAKVTPRWSGTFHVKITMYDSTRDGAHWILQYAYH